uniref:Uncharacterized protein n=1 Tax=Dicentrarchus labrax TaxID=13489 RepID=A0A8C4HW51_DICLA
MGTIFLFFDARSLLTLSTQAKGARGGGRSDGKREHRKISNIQLKFNRTNIGHFRICIISHLWSPDLTNSSALPPNQRIPAGFDELSFFNHYCLFFSFGLGSIPVLTMLTVLSVFCSTVFSHLSVHLFSMTGASD